jgi:chromosomal replication initiator protein
VNSYDEMFDVVKKYCKSKISPAAYDLWVSKLKLLDLKGDTAYFQVETEFQKSIIMEKYTNIVREGFINTIGFDIEFDIEFTEKDKDKGKNFFRFTDFPQEEPKRADELALLESGGEYEYTFDTFIVGASNKFAHAASLAVATNPSGAYNPLFIYGPSGLGKTHLLYAINNEIAKNFPEKFIMYVKGEEFTNELIDAISNNTTSDFHNKYRKVDILLMDDVQFIAGKVQTQEEFFHTFNTLYHAGKQVVLTSDRPPKEIKTLEDRLLTRFESGLMADVSTPDFETRIAIIRRKAELLDMEIPNDVAEYIANKLKNNIRQLEGAVKKLKAFKLLAGSTPSIGLAQTAIRDILSDNQPLPVTIEKIISEVAKTYSVKPEEIRSNKRSAPISAARQIAMYVVKEITQISTTAIGDEFGGRDHSTVVYATQIVEKNMAKNKKYQETVEDIIKNIRDN